MAARRLPSVGLASGLRVYSMTSRTVPSGFVGAGKLRSAAAGGLRRAVCVLDQQTRNKSRHVSHLRGLREVAGVEGAPTASASSAESLLS